MSGGTTRRVKKGPILEEDFVRIVAQGMPGMPHIRSEVARCLANEAEYRLREIIRQAKSYMRHSKRAYLTVEDVAYAGKRRDRQPLLGYTEEIEFVPIRGMDGLYVEKDQIVKLTDVIEAQLPSEQSEPSVEASWITLQALDEINGQPDQQKQLSEWTKKQFKYFYNSVSRTLVNGEDEAEVELALRSIATAKVIQPILGDLSSFIRQKVHENARVTGSTDILCNMVRLMYALFSRERFGVEPYYDQLMPALLTCLLGRKLGKGDHWSLRDFTAFVLQESFKLHEDPIIHGRIIKTLLAVLTDKQTSLDSLYGAIRGLKAAGEEVFEMHFLPHVPALLYNLERASQACEKLESGLREMYDEKIKRICELLERAKSSSPSDTSDVTLLMDVTL